MMENTEETLKEILILYRHEVEKYLESNGSVMTVTLTLTPEFLKTCEERIIKGHKKYGEDWKIKDNLKEKNNEKFDIFNYEMLHRCQEKIK